MATQGALSQAIVLHDTLIQLFPGGDHPELPRDTLVRLPARWEPPACTSAVPSSMLICTAEADTCVAIDNTKMCMLIQGGNEGAPDDSAVDLDAIFNSASFPLLPRCYPICSVFADCAGRCYMMSGPIP